MGSTRSRAQVLEADPSTLITTESGSGTYRAVTRRRTTVSVDLGPIVMVVLLLLVVPVVTLMILAAIAAALSSALKANAEATHAGSELIDLNR